MAIDDAKFFSWLDGELDEAEAAEVEAEVAADPRLAQMAKQHRTFGMRLRDAFDAVGDEPVPERLVAAVKPPRGQIIDFLSRRRARRDHPAWAPVPQWAAIAATLVLGVFIGTALGSESDNAPVEIRGGQMYAAAQLDHALETRLASAGNTEGLRVGLTFRDQAGAICRSFADLAASGLACRDGNDWRLRGLFAASETQAGDYRMAAGADPNLAALIDSTIAGDAFDAEQEKAARDRGWR